jgi:DNA-binding response OmpR family regulator
LDAAARAQLEEKERAAQAAVDACEAASLTADKASAVAKVATRGLSLKAMEFSLLNEITEPI